MPAIPSNMLPLGTIAPDFKILDTVSGKLFHLQQLKPEVAIVLMFICNHCPYVKHVQSKLVRLANNYMLKGVSFIAISSNDTAQYPEDGPEQMKVTALANAYPFPYLYDESQEVAKAYDAACTPDFYIFDNNRILVYRGQLDDSRPKNNMPLTGKDISIALDDLIAGNSPDLYQKPSIGCSIKWKPSSATGTPSAAVM